MESLFELAKNGDKRAYEELVLKNTALVQSIARRFQNRGIEPDDLVQIGLIGLCKAIKNFDPNLGYKFSTYAVWLISGEIRRDLRDNSSVKVSRKIRENALKASYAVRFLRESLGREPTIEEISQQSSIEREDLVMAMEASQEPQSIYEKIGEDGSLIDILPAEDTENENIDKIELCAALGKVSAEERRLIYYRYFEDRTQKDTAKILGTNQVQVSRLEKKILSKMRGSMQE